jgi:hypothetical protein
MSLWLKSLLCRRGDDLRRMERRLCWMKIIKDLVILTWLNNPWSSNTHSYKLGSDFGRLVRLLFGEHSLYDSLLAFGCPVFCFPCLTSLCGVLVCSPMPSKLCVWGDPAIPPEEPPAELVIVLLEPWPPKSVCDGSDCNCDVLLDCCDNRWNCVSPRGRALNDCERSRRRKELKENPKNNNIFFARRTMDFAN